MPSLVFFRGRNVAFSDGHLLLSIYFMWREIEEHPPDYPILHAERETLSWNFDGAGPGCIDLPLDRMLSTSAAIAEFHRLVDATGRSVGRHGDAIPYAELVEYDRLAGYGRPEDCPTDIVTDVLAALRSLVPI